MITGLVYRFINVLSRTITDYEIDIVYQMHKMATKETLDFIIENNLTNLLKLPNNTKLFGLLKDRISEGLILEFGVNRGGSINQIAKLFPNRQIYGFDTFTGLPEDWVILPKGEFDLGGKLPRVEKNVKLIKGLIQETLPIFKKEHDEKIAFIHIDTDLYSSAKTILTELKDQINDTHILFDEYWNFPNWKQEEYKAFMEFIEETGLKFKYIAHNGHTNVLLRVWQ